MLFRLRNTAGLVLLALLAWVSFAIGSTFQTALTIFSIGIWTIAGLMAIYMIVFRGTKFTLFKDDEAPGIPMSEEGEDFLAPDDSVDVRTIPEGMAVDLKAGDVIVRPDARA